MLDALHSLNTLSTRIVHCVYVCLGECDLRIQKIGSHYRVFERRGNNWKTNTGSAHCVEVEMTPKYQMWADECAKLLGYRIRRY